MQEDAAASDEYVPAGHDVQVDAALDEYVPA